MNRSMNFIIQICFVLHLTINFCFGQDVLSEPLFESSLDTLVEAQESPWNQDTVSVLTDEELKYLRPKLEEGLQLIGVMATIAPLLGLLGTVIGMVGTFEVISYFGTSNPSLMAGSIATALVTTQNGILVAMPLLICHILLKNRAGRIEIDTTKAANQLILYYDRKYHTPEEEL